MPDLRLPGGARRPVRQLRQPARSRRPDQSAFDHRRLDARVPRDDSTCSSTCPRSPSGSRRGSSAQEGWRPNVKNFSLGLVRELKPRAMTRDIDWGVPGAGRGLSGGHEADLRLVRRRDRLPVRERRVGAQPRHARGVARVVAEPRRGPLLLHGQGQHRLPLRDLAGDAARLRLRRRARRRQGRPAPADERRRERVPDDGGEEGLDEPQPRDLGRGLPQPLRPRPAALLPHGRRPGDAGHRLHVGRVRAPQQRRAARELGQPRQPHARQRAPQLRRGARARRADRGRHARARRHRRRVRRGRRAHRGGALPRRDRRGDARRARSRTSTSPSRRRGRSSRPTASVRRPCSTSRCAASTRSRRCSRRSCPFTLADRARAARLRRLARRPARVPHRRPRRTARRTRC